MQQLTEDRAINALAVVAFLLGVIIGAVIVGPILYVLFN